MVVERLGEDRMAAERIARLERAGIIAPECAGCAEAYRAIADKWSCSLPMQPYHRPKETCESGKRPHCSCDRCF